MEGFIHCRLERMEDWLDAAHFMSLVASAVFFLFLAGTVFLLLHIDMVYSSAAGYIVFAYAVCETLTSLSLVWMIYQVRTRLFFSCAVLFFLMYAIWVLGNAALILKNDAVPITLIRGPALIGFLAVFCYVGYQLGLAARTVSKATDAERVFLPGKARHTLGGFLLQLFGAPEICLWLPPQRRASSIALFCASTAVFAFFVAAVFSLLLMVPLTNYRNMASSFRCGELMSVTPCFVTQYAFAFVVDATVVSAVFGVSVVAVAGSRFAARRFARLSLEQLISRDKRDPILFLRSFRDDQVKLPKLRQNVVRWIISCGEPRPTLDHILLEEGTPHGPVIAIGAPGSIPPFGAARKFISDHEWRDTVADFCRHARAVVITLDETEGVRWELQHLLSQNHYRKALFLLPPRLTSPTESGRVLRIAFAGWKGQHDCLKSICSTVDSDQRLCIGWYFGPERTIQVLTTLRNSSLAYVLAVRSFLNGSGAAVAPATADGGNDDQPPPSP